MPRVGETRVGANNRLDRNRLLTCKVCRQQKPAHEFYKKIDGKFDVHWCQTCWDSKHLIRVNGRYKNPNPATEGTKECGKCGLEKHVSMFWKCVHRIDGLANWCKECHRDHSSADGVKRNRREKMISRKYGISLADVDRMLEEQDSRCKCCNKEFEEFRVETVQRIGRHGNRVFGGFKVDHCHSTGAVRGLLCNNCNMMIGLAHDDIQVLQRAIDYLSSTQVGVLEQQ